MHHYTVNDSLPIDTTKKKIEKQTDSLKGNAKCRYSTNDIIPLLQG